ncbi:hypothetical protein EVG20_g8834 [Dentipellis fragilis]|uniref:F-box domain-containing protein n=1 Tax=Dentipellis fragilis TaxID=205917 RepID=A0A4Y9Y2M0_9AGAM|nr:hypothetical protein EVG20_g8834 [Dentipellis fragilis]
MDKKACDSLSALEKLNGDVLLRILHYFNDDNIAQLSLTSKHLRTVCLPTLFQKAKVRCQFIAKSDPPPASWPYIRTIEIAGSFSSGIGFDAGHLRQILPHLVALRKVHFRFFTWGVYWYILDFLLAAPNIRALEIEEPSDLERSDLSFPDEVSPATLPFTEFVYTIHAPRPPSWSNFKPPETIARRCYMSPLVLSLHQTLEVLHLPSAMAPLQEMAVVHWPRLRELKLYSENYEGEDPTIFARLFSGMPQLRNLDLHFFHKGPSRQTLIMPSDATFTTSFDHLDSIHIPYPDPNDNIYDCLPPTLRRMQLVDRPRYYRFNTKWMESIEGYTRPLLITATELLCVIKRLGPLAILEHLEFAYQADSQDFMLPTQIAEFFPNLRSLELHRYRSEGETDIHIESAVENIANALSTLRHFRHFRIYLNLFVDDYRPPKIFKQELRTDSISCSDFMTLLRHYAMKIVRNCSSSLQIIDFLTTYVYGEQFWMRHYVGRDDRGKAILELDDPAIIPLSRLFVFLAAFTHDSR